MMKKGLLSSSILVVLLVVGMVGGLSSPAYADTIGTVSDPCAGSCFGATFTLTSPEIDLDPGANTRWRFTLTADTTGVVSPRNFLQSFGAKVVSNGNFVSAALVATNFTGTFVDNGNGTASGCNALPDSAFTCLQDSLDNPTGAGKIYTFNFDVTSKNGFLTGGSTVKATFCDNTTTPPGAACGGSDGGRFRGQVGEAITIQKAVPEPASLLLLGAGLAGIGLSQWRRRKAGQA